MNRKYIGVDVGGTSVKLGIVDDKGQVHLRKEAVYTEAGSTAPVMDVIIGSIRELADASIGIEAFSGIGVSAAGCINSVEGKVAINGGNVPNWSHTEVCSILRKEFDIPVTLANDANCAILGEFWTGAAKGYTDVLGITLGTGVGGGIIIGGKIVSGSTGAGGEIGHIHLEDEEPAACGCGGHGCLEQYASATGVVRIAKKKLAFSDTASVLRDKEITAKDIWDAVKEGDELAIEVAKVYGEYLGKGLAAVANVVNPDIFVIGGGVSKAGEVLIDYMKPYFEKYVFPGAKNAKFALAVLGMMQVYTEQQNWYWIK